jgi:hypothetical protein
MRSRKPKRSLKACDDGINEPALHDITQPVPVALLFSLSCAIVAPLPLFLLFHTPGLKKRDDEGADEECKQHNFHCAEGFFSLHGFSP